MDNFMLATRNKYRFVTCKGQLTVEDLWDLPLTSATGKPNLDDIAKDLYRQLKDGEEISFVHTDDEAEKVKAKVTETQITFDIVKYVIDTKLAEAKAAKEAMENKARRQRILELIAKKEEDFAAEVAKQMK